VQRQADPLEWSAGRTLEVDTVVENPVPKCTPWLHHTRREREPIQGQVDIRYTRKPDR